MAKIEEDVFDQRVRNLNLKRGNITREDLEKYLKKLPDDSEWAEEQVVYDEESEIEEELQEEPFEEVEESDSFDSEPENI